MSKKKKAWAEDVFESWGGYMEAKKAKLEEQFTEYAKTEYQDTSTLFNGVAIFVNGYTDPTSDELKRLMMQHGGIFHHYLRPQQTTHMIASNLPYSKIVMYLKSKNPLPLCKPSWITESIKAGKLLDFRNYLLYSQCTKTQPHLLNIFKPLNTTNPTSNDEGSTTKLPSNTENLIPQNNSESQFSPVKVFPPKLESSAKFSIEENSDLLNKSISSKNDTEFSKLSVNNSTNKPEASNKNEDKESPKNKSKSCHSSICSKNSDFISDFYNNSRLHHIATMGATFKDYINELRDKNKGKFPGLERLIVESKFNRPGPSTKLDSDSEDDIFAIDSSPEENLQGNVIMHIDMDCFFVSVGIRDRPELKGLPVAVTHAKGNKPTNSDGNQEGSYSEVASCSYEARKLGLKNGMFLGQALKLCPNLKTIKYDFEGYKEVSYVLYDTVASYTLDIEAVSCDEMYADCSTILLKSGLTPLEFAEILRKEIKEKTRCPVSTGFGGNKLQARLATKKAKPDGKFHLKSQDVSSYIGTLNVKDLPGVGYSTSNKFNIMNVKTCADLQKILLPTLQQEFGKKTGELLYNMCRGIDNSKLSVEHVRKSISAEVNYGIRFENHLDAETFLEKLSTEVCSRLKKANAKGRCITLKLMVRAKEAPKETAKFMGHGICDYFTKSKNLIASVDNVSIIYKEILLLWNQMHQVPEDIRGIGIQMSRLEILKHKVNTAGLMDFINKAKQPTSEEKVVNDTNNPQEISDQKKESSTCLKSETISSETVFEKSNVQNEGNSVFLKDKIILPSQDIDDSVLNELPEDIKREIMSSKNFKSKSSKLKKGSCQGSKKSIQTKQESYFTEKKPNIPKGKAELPPIQEIDMAVLVELPEDIRNEILNAYKTTDSSETSSSSAKPIKDKDKSEMNLDTKVEKKLDKGTNSNLNYLTDEKELSLSQVDPEFLAALPEDVRDDMQMYFMKKKQEKNNAERKKMMARKDKGVSKSLSMFKGSKNSKISKSRSTRGRKLKGVFGRNNGVVSRQKEIEPDKNKLEKVQQADKQEEAQMLERERERKEEEEEMEIISHMRSFPTNAIKSRGQEKALTSLVKCMSVLSVDQIKMQIQNWISNSEVVNEIDILSLATYLSMLPGRKLIEDLHVFLKCMHRCITKSGSCIWHETYRKIVEHVQHYMQIEYNSDLMVPPIGCNLHKCKGDNVF